LQLLPVAVQQPDEFDSAFATMAAQQPDALFLGDDAVLKQNPQSSRQNSRPSAQIEGALLSCGSKAFRLKFARCCFTLLWLPTYCPRANPIERAFGDVHDKCTRNHKRKRLRDLVQDVERHVQENGPWQYQLSHLYAAPEVTAAVEHIAAEQQPKLAA
jgi:hypothetical protein